MGARRAVPSSKGAGAETMGRGGEERVAGRKQAAISQLDDGEGLHRRQGDK